MKCTNLACAMTALVIAAVVAFSAPAQAQNNRSWVAGNGVDTNTCLRAAPCLTLAGAYAKTNIGGEINCADPGTYSSLTIGHSITIDCPRGFGLTNGIIINIPVGTMGDPKRTVILRGLDMSGFASEPGLEIQDAASVTLDRVSMYHFTGHGIFDHRTTGANQLFILDSTISNNGTSGGLLAGVYVKPGSGVTATVTIERSHIKNNPFGIIADGTAGGTIRGAVSDSFVAGNLHNGITANASGTTVNLAVNNTTVTGNDFGLVAAGSNASLLVRRSFVTANATGLIALAGGVLFSYQDNSVNGNTTTDGTFTAFIGTK